ncbi:MAG: cupin domain-containing protein [Anaerolineae bacterium]
MIQKVDLTAVAEKLTEPYMLVELAQVEEFVARLFICQGGIAWHKHIDEDELFFVCEGEISLESEWGGHTLRTGELAVVPKGVTHRSTSSIRSVVLLFERRLFSDRQDGKRRLFVLRGQDTLKKASVRKAAEGLAPFAPLDLASVDGFVAQAVVYQGRSNWGRNPQTLLLFLQEGEVELETDEGRTKIECGEIARMPKGLAHRLQAEERAVALLLLRKPRTVEGG